jgi:hypothetical protein
MFGERAHAVGKTRSAKPTQQFLRAVGKEYDSENNASYSHDPVSVRTCETLDHRSFSSTANFFPASPTIYTKSRGRPVTASTNSDSPKIDFAGVDAGAKMFVGIRGCAVSAKAAAAPQIQTTTGDIRTPQLIEPVIAMCLLNSA